MFVYIGTCVPWMAIETKSSKLCIICSLDEHLYAQLSKWALWLVFVMSKNKLSLVLRKDWKSWEKGINNHLTIVTYQSWNDTCMLRHSKSAVSMTFVCLGIAKLECQIPLGISSLSFISPCMVCLKEKYAKKNQKQKDQKFFKYDCKCVF